LRVRLIDGLNCTRVEAEEKPPGRKLTVPVLETIFSEILRVYPNKNGKTGPGASFASDEWGVYQK
ncbi:hypothetical protein, partial [Acidovorax sp. Root267]|uniref:hypothetical protein n=1 Tax=Acidovorax sp. Root267 TaxID=1736505 RepID=UPI001A7E4571